jgi:hypothetical protein
MNSGTACSPRPCAWQRSSRASRSAHLAGRESRLDVEALKPRVYPGDQPSDPIEVVALGAFEHPMQQLLECLCAQSAQPVRVQCTEAGAVGEPVILRRVIAATDGTCVSNREGRKATLRAGTTDTQGHQTDLRRSLVRLEPTVPCQMSQR